MEDTQLNDSQNAPVAVTLQLEPKVYEFFHQKAQNAGVGIESYLCSTLTIVLGCRAFGAMSVCSPQLIAQVPTSDAPS